MVLNKHNTKPSLFTFREGLDQARMEAKKQDIKRSQVLPLPATLFNSILLPNALIEKPKEEKKACPCVIM